MATVGRQFTYENPFARNHCVVHAWTHLSGGNADSAVALAAKARAQRHMTRAGVVHDIKTTWWADAVGLRVVREVRLIRASYAATGAYGTGGYFTPVRSLPTLQSFAWGHPRGKYWVRVQGHAVAVIDGKIFGSWRPRSRVVHYVEVEG